MHTLWIIQQSRHFCYQSRECFGATKIDDTNWPISSDFEEACLDKSSCQNDHRAGNSYAPEQQRVEYQAEDSTRSC